MCGECSSLRILSILFLSIINRDSFQSLRNHKHSHFDDIFNSIREETGKDKSLIDAITKQYNTSSLERSFQEFLWVQWNPHARISPYKLETTHFGGEMQ